MKSKKLIKAGLGFMAGLMLMSASVAPVLAYSGEGENTTITSEDEYKQFTENVENEKNGSDEPSLNVDWDVLVNENAGGEGILTPEGNLTLVDDIDEAHSENLQYMTVQTKGGNFFYIVVDRSGDEDNVYFLNMVDEADLMALMDEETQDKFNEAMKPTVKEEEKKDDSTVLFSNQDTKEETEVKEEAPVKEKGSNPAAMLIVFIVIGAGVAGGYYFFKIKPAKEQPDVDEDIEFYDDEDYIDEDSIIEDVDHDTLVNDNDSNEDERPQVDDFSDESIDE